MALLTGFPYLDQHLAQMEAQGNPAFQATRAKWERAVELALHGNAASSEAAKAAEARRELENAERIIALAANVWDRKEQERRAEKTRKKSQRMTSLKASEERTCRKIIRARFAACKLAKGASPTRPKMFAECQAELPQLTARSRPFDRAWKGETTAKAKAPGRRKSPQKPRA